MIRTEDKNLLKKIAQMNDDLKVELPLHTLSCLELFKMNIDKKPRTFSLPNDISAEIWIFIFSGQQLFYIF